MEQTGTFIQKIFDLFVELLPANWQKFVLHASIDPDMQAIDFYTRVEGTDKFYSWIDLRQRNIFTQDEFLKVSMTAEDESLNYQKEFKPAWTGYTLVISRNGSADLQFEYYEQSLMIPDSWKEKYLK